MVNQARDRKRERKRERENEKWTSEKINKRSLHPFVRSFKAIRLIASIYPERGQVIRGFCIFMSRKFSTVP